MFKTLKLIIRNLLFTFSKFIYATKVDIIFNTFKAKHIKKIKYKNNTYFFINKNLITNYRINTFSTKEPETIKWIDNFKSDSTFWDIGANVGIYSIYAAKSKKCNVVSFEPSFSNLEILSNNIILNKLNHKIIIAPIALNNSTAVNYLNSLNILEGSAHSNFGKKTDQKGNSFETEISYKTLGLSLDTFNKIFRLNEPDYIKIDVDGIEHLILEGGLNLINKTKEILLEVNPDYKEQYDKINLIFKKNKFKLIADFFNKDINQGNQIWIKENE